MKIALLGYGKMGQEIERLALKRGHEIAVILDNREDWVKEGHLLNEADIAIDFSTPASIVENIYRCFDANLPLVTGTTGWLDELDRVKHDCLMRGQCLFFAPNFSIGVNLFFDLNRYLAGLMSTWKDYSVSIEETHHIHKQDAPSGTAIVIANDIIRYLEHKEKWVNALEANPEELGIRSYRTDNVPGTHTVRYESDEDSIEIIHTAKNRRGFAMGAILASEWVLGKKGFFDMDDLLGAQIISGTG